MTSCRCTSSNIPLCDQPCVASSRSLSLQELDTSRTMLLCPPDLEPMQQVMTATGPASPRYVEDAVDIIRKVHRTQGPGHVLAFFTGQEEIERASRLLSEAVAQEKVDRRAMDIEEEVDNGVSEMIVVPLFGALSAEAQADAFKPARAGVRKVRPLVIRSWGTTRAKWSFCFVLRDFGECRLSVVLGVTAWIGCDILADNWLV